MFLIPGTNTILPAVQVSSAKAKAENAWKSGYKEFVSGPPPQLHPINATWSRQAGHA